MQTPYRAEKDLPGVLRFYDECKRRYNIKLWKQFCLSAAYGGRLGSARSTATPPLRSEKPSMLVAIIWNEDIVLRCAPVQGML